MNKEISRTEMRHPLWQIFMLLLSAYSLFVLSVEFLIVENPEVQEVVFKLDFLLCLLFFADFLYLFFTADSKRRYMLKWGWIDLLSSIPLVEPLRWGRLARIFRIIKVLRVLKSLSVIGASVKASPLETLSMMMFIVVFVSFSVSSGLILGFEEGFGSGITTGRDALWWSFLSIMNAKGGFHVAASPEGVLTTVFLNKIGLLLFAYLNGTIISWLLSARVNATIDD